MEYNKKFFSEEKGITDPLLNCLLEVMEDMAKEGPVGIDPEKIKIDRPYEELLKTCIFYLKDGRVRPKVVWESELLCFLLNQDSADLRMVQEMMILKEFIFCWQGYEPFQDFCNTVYAIGNEELCYKYDDVLKLFCGMSCGNH